MSSTPPPPASAGPSEETQGNSSLPEKEKKLTKPAAATGDLSDNYLEGLPLAVVMIGLMSCIFLPALDQLILTTAIPRIVSKFNALSQISWIPNAYFLTMASFMVIYGQILNLASLKSVIISSIMIFEIGSLLCGVAFNMNFLLFGRGIAGVGAAGLFVCIFAAIAQIAPLEKRPRLMGIGGAMFGISSIIGPLIGGVLTDHASWRWCFFINLPIGGLAAAAIFFFLPNYPAPPKPANRQGWRTVLGVDYVGAILIIGMTVTFLFPLVEGGNAHPWKSAMIISLFITSGILAALFFLWSKHRGLDALLPIHLFTNRTVIGASMSAFFIWLSLMIGAVYLTTWYQAVKGHHPTRSGVDLLPFSLLISGFSIISGLIATKTGRYWHLLVGMPLLCSIGSGLEYTINEGTSEGKLVGYQILWGAGIGASLQLPILAVQAEYRDNLVDTRFVTSLATFVGFIGRMVGLGIGSALFTNKLEKYLTIYAPHAPLELVLHSVDAIWKLPVEQRVGVVHAYVLSMRYIFIIGVPAGALASIAALLVRNHKLIPPQGRPADAEAGPPAEKE